MKIRASIIAALAYVGCLFQVHAFGGDLVLRYDAPAPMNASGWEQRSLPIGNGRIGGSFFGGLETERLLYNEDTLWTGDGSVHGSYQAFGNLDITLPGHGKGTTDYSRELDLENGEGRVSYKKDGITYRREFFASHPAQVVVVRLTADQPGAYTGLVKLTDLHGARTLIGTNTLTAAGGLAPVPPPAPKRGTPAATLPATRPLGPPTMLYESQAMVINDGGTLRASAGGIAFEKCNSITILVVAGTDYVFDHSKAFHGEPPHQKVAAQLTEAAGRASTLWEEHLKDYRQLFARVSLNLGDTASERSALPTDKRLEMYTADGKDPGLEALFFQYGRYLLIASSRDSLPANLQGLWTGNNSPPWGADYHTNINVQMNYWPAEPANLSECTKPLFDFVSAQIPVYRKTVGDIAAKAAASPPPATRGTPAENFLSQSGKPVRGWAVRTETNPFGFMSYTWNKTGNAWYAQHFWEHYAFTQDRHFLRDVAYPMMKEVCEFWVDDLKELPDGELVAPNGWSPEHGPVEDGVNYDQEIIWDLFDNTVHAADALNTDKDFRDSIASMRDRLAKPGIGSWGQLLEWRMEKTADRVLDKPTDTHRHVSHLFGLFPGHQITSATPEWLDAAKVTLKARGDAGTGWSMAWKIAYWARLLDGDHALKMLRGQLAVPGSAAKQENIAAGFDSNGGTFPNLWDAHPPFQIDGNFGATAAICEMLLQSQAGQIRLLPALPALWSTGSVRGLCARGGFEMDEAWKDGRLTSVTVRSAKGGIAKLRYGTVAAQVNLRAGEHVVLDGGLKTPAEALAP